MRVNFVGLHCPNKLLTRQFLYWQLPFRKLVSKKQKQTNKKPTFVCHPITRPYIHHNSLWFQSTSCFPDCLHYRPLDQQMTQTKQPSQAQCSSHGWHGEQKQQVPYPSVSAVLSNGVFFFLWSFIAGADHLNLFDFFRRVWVVFALLDIVQNGC